MLLYRRDYQVDAGNAVEFTGEPVPVTLKKEYISIQANKEKGGVNNMKKDKKDKKSCCPEQVNTIIQSNRTRFEESDKEWLEGLEEEALIKLLPMEEDASGGETQAGTDSAQANAEAEVITREQAIEVLKEQFSTTGQFLELMPKDIKNQLEFGLKLHEEKRKETIEQIKANTSVFGDDELNSKNTDELIKLARAVVPQADYSAQNTGGGEPQANVVEPMGFPGMETTN
jgi:hypothetical protein